MRSAHKYVEVTGAKGINQQEDLADPRTELLDARNLWAPDGKVVQRPGYRGVVPLLPFDWNGGALTDYRTPINGFGPYFIDDQRFCYYDAHNIDAWKETPLGTFTKTSTFSSLAAGSRIVFQFDSAAIIGGAMDSVHDLLAFVIYFHNAGDNNSAATKFSWEYCDGTSWKQINIVEVDVSTRAKVTNAFSSAFVTKTSQSDSISVFAFIPPQDWVAPTDVTVGVPAVGTGLLYLRAKLVGAAFDGTVVTSGTAGVDVADLFYRGLNGDRVNSYCPDAALINYGVGKHIMAMAASDIEDIPSFGDAELAAVWTTDLQLNALDGLHLSNAGKKAMSIAVIPQFGVAYIAMAGGVFTFAADTRASDYWGVFYDTADIAAEVESDAAFVGDGAPYDSAVVSQLGAFPEALDITFYKGQLWAALENNSVRWSAPIPAYKVWPTLNIEVLPDNNNDHTQALIGFQESMHVFKPDSIWKFVDAGISEFQLQTYAPIKVVSGTGLIAPKGYVVTDNGIFFMSQQGISFFDGVNTKVISQRIRPTLDRLSSGKLDRIRATHWRSRQCVLFAVPVDGSEFNNLVLVYDYKNDSWWVWNNIEVAGWLYDDSDLVTDKLYFMDTLWGIHEFGVTDEDHGGAIESYFQTHILAESPVSKRFREVEISGKNVADSVLITLMTNDEAEAEGTEATVDFTDTLEAKWGTAVWGTDTWVAERDRVRRIAFLETGTSCKIRVDHSEKNTPFEMTSLKLGLVAIGRRR